MKNEKDIQVLHALPGRVRIKLSRLKNDMAYASRIQQDILALPGITHLETNPKTGSLLIEHDQNVLDILVLHPAVLSCLGSPSQDIKQPSAKDPTKTLKTSPKRNTKSKGKPKQKNASKKGKGGSRE